MFEILKKVDRRLFPDLLITCLKRELTTDSTVLDIGCGKGGPLLRLPKPLHLTGIDVFQPSLDRLKKRGHYDTLVCQSVEDADFKKGAFDLVVCLDFIEHFEKDEAMKMLEKFEMWAKKKVLIYTPNGFLEQYIYDGNMNQLHKCGFTTREFTEMGYLVRGTGGPKWLRKERAGLRFWPSPLWHRISAALQPFSYFFPQTAFALFAVKKIRGK